MLHSAFAQLQAGRNPALTPACPVQRLDILEVTDVALRSEQRGLPSTLPSALAGSRPALVRAIKVSRSLRANDAMTLSMMSRSIGIPESSQES